MAISEGDCVEATVQAADGGDIVEGRKTLLLHGRVDKAGVAYFKEPLRRYTLIPSDSDKDARAGRARLPPCALTRPPPGGRPGALRAPAQRAVPDHALEHPQQVGIALGAGLAMQDQHDLRMRAGRVIGRASPSAS